MYEGRRIQRSLGVKDKPIAERLAKLRIVDIIRETRKPMLILDALVNKYLDQGVGYWKEKTRKEKLYVLLQFKQFVSGKSFSAIRKEDIVSFIGRYDFSRSSRRRYLSVLRAFFNWLIDYEYINQSPMRGIKVGSSDRRVLYLTPKELTDLISASPEHWKPIWSFLVMTGLRAGEVYNLKWKDIKPDYIIVRSSKLDEEEVIPKSEQLSKVLDLMPKNNSYVVSHSTGLRPEATFLSKLFKKVAKRAGLDSRYTLHTLRHTCATWLVQSEYNVAKVQKYMRHKNVATTMIYTHISTRDIEDCSDTIYSLIGG